MLHHISLCHLSQITLITAAVSIYLFLSTSIFWPFGFNMTLLLKISFIIFWLFQGPWNNLKQILALKFKGFLENFLSKIWFRPIIPIGFQLFSSMSLHCWNQVFTWCDVSQSWKDCRNELQYLIQYVWSINNLNIKCRKVKLSFFLPLPGLEITYCILTER